MKHAAAIAFAAVLVGCVSAPQERKSYEPMEQAVSLPPLNQVQEVGIGEEVMKDGRFVVRDSIYVPKSLEISSYTVSAGSFKKVGESDDGEFFLPGGGTDIGAIIPQPLVDPAQSLLVRRKDGALCVVTVSNLSSCGRRTEAGFFANAEGFERRRRREPAEGATTRSLTYNGLAGTRVRLAYRETSSTMPATSNEVEYDLNAGRVVEYRGARIEVLDATNRSLKYRVLQHFRAPG